MPESESNESRTETRQVPWCWECQRRRLVCDQTKPVCNKCRITGIVCPGYGDKKPLTWLAPGKVKSRERKRKSSPKNSGEASKSSVIKTKKKPDAGVQNHQLIVQPEFNVESKQSLEAADYCKSFLQGRACALKQMLTMNSIDNNNIYPMFLMNQLAPTPFIAPVVVPLFRYLPIAAIRIMVSMALRHRAFQLSQNAEQTSASELWSRSYHYHDLSIRGLNEDLSKEATRSNDFTISTVGLFLIAEVGLVLHLRSPNRS